MRRDLLWFLAWLAAIGLSLHYGRRVAPWFEGASGTIASGLMALAGLLALIWSWRRWRSLEPGRRTRAGLTLAAAALGLAWLAWWQPLTIERTHLFLYGGLGWTAYRLMRHRLIGAEQAGAATAVCAGVGLADEVIQHLHPERVFDLRDVATNTLSAALVIWAAAALGVNRPGNGS